VAHWSRTALGVDKPCSNGTAEEKMLIE